MGKHTPGPWKWWYPRGANSPVLVSPPHGLCVVMDTVRKGMTGATLRFAKRSDGMGGVLLNADQYIETDDERRPDFCTVNHPDALLIAAAPDLLVACKAMIAIVGDHQHLLGESQVDDLAQARAAIAKAQGRAE